MKVALIATGNEVASGQILNSNASLLASWLSDLGCQVVNHYVVPDDSEELMKVLKRVQADDIDAVFSIGGLGPTRDDLTRQVIADFSGAELILNEQDWKVLKANLESRQITPREGHKWQCYFPKGAQVLPNPAGTAQAFGVEVGGLNLWALPGPPNELEAIYGSSLKELLKLKVRPEFKLETWLCLGRPESELAHEVEEALKGCDYELGYRASPPFVEVKLWVPLSEMEKNPWVRKLDVLTQDFLYSKNGLSYLKDFLDVFLSKRKVVVLDELTEGQFLLEVLKVYKSKPQLMTYISGSLNTDFDLRFFIQDKKAKLEVKTKQGVQSFESNVIKEARLKKSPRAKTYALMVLIKEAFVYYQENPSAF